MSSSATTSVSARARAIALAGDATRLRILRLLFACQGACVSDVAGRLRAPVANISHHLRALEDGGLVRSTRKGKTICYALRDSPLIRSLRRVVCVE